jgi:outer membrane lipoprotein-sorting protein
MSWLAVCAFLLAVVAMPAASRAQSAPSLATGVAPATTPGRAVLDQFAAAWATVTAYTATITVAERKAAQLQNIVLDYTFRKPTSVTVHVNAGPNAGVTMVWDGGTTIVAHRGSGFAALFKKTLSLHDPQATTIRGSSIDQLSFGAILVHAQQEAGSISETAPSTVNGVSVVAVTLVSAEPTTNTGLTREVVALSTSTHLPVQVLGYDGPTLVRQIDFSNVILQR